MDAIILAAGKGSRLDGVMPPHWKPLMPINAVPLICRLVDQVTPYVEQVLVVAAPENTLPMSQVLGERNATMIVQRRSDGPGAALQLALELSHANVALVVMGDNLIADNDVAACVNSGRDFVVGYQHVQHEDAHRFTRIVSPTQFEEGPYVSADPARGNVNVWCGPLVLPRDDTLVALRDKAADYVLGSTERKIGTHLTKLAELHGPAKLELVAAIDLGTPEAIMEVQA